MLLLTVVVNWIFFIGASVMSVMAFVNMAIDKRRAENGGWRIAERKLLMQTMAGGFFGTFLAMIFLSHKVRKFKFWICVILSFVVWSWIRYTVLVFTAA